MRRASYSVPTALLIALWILPLCGQAQSAAADTSPAADQPVATVATIPVKTVPVKETPPPRAAESEPTQLDEIVVTATKTAQPVRKIPATINVLLGEDLERKGIQDVEEIVRLVPGVNLTHDVGDVQRITIRGISGASTTNLTTGVMIGDVPFADPYLPVVSPDPNPFDMATVEILKGPQGTLFGGSGLNGAIRYVPEPPKFAETELKYFAQYTQYPRQRSGAPIYGAVINTPLAGDKLALRLMGFQRRSAGYVDSVRQGVRESNVNRTDQFGVRGILGWRPAENWDIALMHIRQDTQLKDIATTDNVDGRLERHTTPRKSPSKTQYALSNLGVTYHLAWADFVSQTSVTGKKFHSFTDISKLVASGRKPALGAISDATGDAVIQEFRLVSTPDAGSRWRWLGGVFAFREQEFLCTDVPSSSPAALLPAALPGTAVTPPYCATNRAEGGNDLNANHIVTDARITEYALFGEMTRKLGDNWDVTAGARAYQTASGGISRASGALSQTSPSTSGSTEQTAQGGINDRGISPKLALSYRAAENLLTYLSASRGYRFGGLNTMPSNVQTMVPTTFKSDSLWNYEAGLRSQWFDNALLGDLSIYYIDWKDPQLLQIADLLSYIGNVGGARGKGVELSTAYRPAFLSGLSLSVGVAYADTVTTKPFTTAKGTSTQPGAPWPLSPHWQVSSTLAWRDIIGSWSVGPALTHTYSSKAFYDLDKSAEVYGYSTLDLHLDVSNIENAWLPELSLALTNLTDKRGITSNNNQQGTASASGGLLLDFHDVLYLPPRAVMLRLGGHFF